MRGKINENRKPNFQNPLPRTSSVKKNKVHCSLFFSITSIFFALIYKSYNYIFTIEGKNLVHALDSNLESIIAIGMFDVK